MDVLIRNLDPSIVKRIDELAKSKKLKRQEFLHRYISNLAVLEEMKSMQEKFTELQNQSLMIIKQNTEVMKRMINVIDEIESEEE